MSKNEANNKEKRNDSKRSNIKTKPICRVKKQAQIMKVDISLVAITMAPGQQLFGFLVAGSCIPPRWKPQSQRNKV